MHRTSNIIEQCMEYPASIHLNFIYFKKGFDRAHCATLWKLLKPYGIPQAKIWIIKALYGDFTCSVLHQGNLPFAVETGVKQRCTLLPLLFLIALDWVLKETTSHQCTS